MTATPGTPEDWTDTEEPKRAEAFVEHLPAAVGYNLRHYADTPHRTGEGCPCRPSRIPHIPHVVPTVSEPDRDGPLSDEQASEDASEAPQEVQPAPSEPVFIDPATQAPRTRVEVDWPNGNRGLYYVDQGGYQIFAGSVGDGRPFPWGDGRIVRVLTEAKPSEGASALPDLPRPIAPEDVRVGMVVERRKGDAAHRDRVQRIDGDLIDGSQAWPYLWVSEQADDEWSLWLIEDAPAPVDPDAKLVERMAHVMHDQQCADNWDRHGGGTQRAWRDDARDVLATLRATHDVTPRAEQ